MLITSMYYRTSDGKKAKVEGIITQNPFTSLDNRYFVGFIEGRHTPVIWDINGKSIFGDIVSPWEE